jgi:hypothetical protein
MEERWIAEADWVITYLPCEIIGMPDNPEKG